MQAFVVVLAAFLDFVKKHCGAHAVVKLLAGDLADFQHRLSLSNAG